MGNLLDNLGPAYYELPRLSRAQLGSSGTLSGCAGSLSETAKSLPGSTELLLGIPASLAASAASLSGFGRSLPGPRRITFRISQCSDRKHQILKGIPRRLDKSSSIQVIPLAIQTSICCDPHINLPKSLG